VGDRRVDQQGPQQGEDDEGLELLAFGEGAGDQGRCDDGEHHLEGHVGAGRDGRRVRDRVLADAVQADEVQAADDAPTVDVCSEGQGEANRTHVTLTSARMKMLCMIVLRTFLRRTRPP